MATKRICPWCGNVLDRFRYAAFCYKNPNAEKNSAAWRRGDKRFKFVRGEKVIISPVLVLQ